MTTFFVKGLARLSEALLGNGTESKADVWDGYCEQAQREREIVKMKEKAFLQQLVW